MKKYKEVIKRGWLKGLTVHHNSIALYLENRDLDQPRKFGTYLFKIGKMWILARYIGKAVIYYNLDGSLSCSRTRFLSHKNDALVQLIKLVGPQNCEVYTIEGLTENEAKGVEAFLIELIEGSTMSYGQKRWRGEQFLNKRCEDIDRTLIEHYNLDGNNDIEALRRQINGY